MKIFCVVECVWMVIAVIAVGVAVCFFDSFLCSLNYIWKFLVGVIVCHTDRPVHCGGGQFVLRTVYLLFTG